MNISSKKEWNKDMQYSLQQLSPSFQATNPQNNPPPFLMAENKWFSLGVSYFIPK